MNNSLTDIQYTAPGGGAHTLASGRAAVWADGELLIADLAFAGQGAVAGPINRVLFQMDSTTIATADFDNFTVFEGAQVLGDYDASSGILFQDRFEGESLANWSTLDAGRSVAYTPTMRVVADTENRFGYGSDYRILRLFRAQNFTILALPTEPVEVMTLSFEVIPGVMAENARWTHFNYLGGDGTTLTTTQRAHTTTLRPFPLRGANGEWAIDGSGAPTFGVPNVRYQIDSILNNSLTQDYTYQDAQGNTRTLLAGRADVWVNGVLVQAGYNANRNAAGNYGLIRALSMNGDSAADSTFDLANFTLLRGGHVLPQIGPDRDPGVGEGYAAWRTDQFGPDADNPEISGPGADPDGDGISNLLEYALGGNPLQPNRDLLPVQGFGTFSVGGVEGEYLTLSFTAPDAVDDVIYAVETSGDLISWAGEGVLEEAVENQDGTTTFTFRDTERMSEGNRRFMRLAVSQE